VRLQHSFRLGWNDRPIDASQWTEGRDIKKLTKPGDGASTVFSAVGDPLPVRMPRCRRIFKVAALTSFSNSKSARRCQSCTAARGRRNRECDRVRAGVSRVIDGGQSRCLVFRGEPYPARDPVMPPQDNRRKNNLGKTEAPRKWSTAEQLPCWISVEQTPAGTYRARDGVVGLSVRHTSSRTRRSCCRCGVGAVDRPPCANRVPE